MGPLETDHVIRPQRLWALWREAQGRTQTNKPEWMRLMRTAELDELTADLRNRMLMCAWHRHLVSRRLLRPPLRRFELPPAVEEFAASYGLEWTLDTEFSSTPARSGQGEALERQGVEAGRGVRGA